MSEVAVVKRFSGMLLSTLRWRLALVFGLGIVTTLTAGLGLVLLVPLLSLVGVQAGSGSTEPFVEFVRSGFDRLGVEPTAAALLALNAGVLLAAAALDRYQKILERRVYESFNLVQRSRLFEAITRARWRHSVNERASDNVHLLTAEVDRMGMAAYDIVGLVSKVLMVAVHLVVAIVLSPLLTGLVAVAGLLLAVVSQPLARQAKRRGEEVSQAFRGLYSSISEHLNGLKTIKAHGLEAEQVRDFRGKAAAAADSLVDVVRNQANVGFVLRAGSALVLTAIVWVALSLENVTPAGLLVLLYLFARLVPMLTGLQRSYQAIISELSAIVRFEEAMATFEGEREASTASESAPTPAREIELRDVSFAYAAGADGPALQDIDLVIPVGRTTAIVGPSGGGKSTLADLLIGLLSPSRGGMFIDGVELTDEQRPSWRQRVSYVSQDIFMFHASVRENLLVAKPGATEDELRTALATASAGFVSSLPDGLDTVVGERGVKLSGGERQRLALARALLRSPDLLVLDEATSNLDSINEARVQEAISALHGHVTLVVIAHRLATVKDADLIHVVRDGSIVESGTWTDLAQREGSALRGLATAQGLEPVS